VAHVPKWKERLILKPKELSIEKPEKPVPAPDVKTMMLNTIVDLENELKRLKKQAKSMEAGQRPAEDDVDRLAYIREELEAILPG
ncbi:MAG: MBL fold metallo-hydrolase, partial [FCB group bacterium]|nr:MBL fold metallo-hydrolase [FCB group bacterium]